MLFIRDAGIVMKTLNNRYGNGHWKITKREYWLSEVSTGPWSHLQLDGKRFTVTSDYTGGKPFHVYVGARHFVTCDCFLPTFYCIKYGVDYEFSEEKREKDSFQKLAKKIGWICRYHYPYPDDKNYFTTGYWGIKDGYNTVHEYEASSLWNPPIVKSSPEKGIEPDLIPNEGRVYELSESIEMIEKYYCFSRKKNPDVNDKEFYEYVFDKHVTDAEIKEYLGRMSFE